MSSATFYALYIDYIRLTLQTILYTFVKMNLYSSLLCICTDTIDIFLCLAKSNQFQFKISDLALSSIGYQDSCMGYGEPFGLLHGNEGQKTRPNTFVYC